MSETVEAIDGEIIPKKEKTSLELRREEIGLEKSAAVATSTSSSFDPIIYAQMKQLATDLIAGGAISPDADTPEKLVVKLQAGIEVGMKPVESMNSLYIVNGRVTIWGSALIKRIRLSGWTVAYKDEDAEKCTIVVTKDGETIEDTFLFKDAQDSGYTSTSTGVFKVGWKQGQNRKLKMRYGAASQLVKTYLPEVLGTIAGVKEVDEDAPATNSGSDQLSMKEKLMKKVDEAKAKALDIEVIEESV